jgi:hypothetical protein
MPTKETTSANQSFRRWLTETGQTQVSFAARLGKHRSAVNRALLFGAVSFSTERLRLQIERLEDRSFWHSPALMEAITTAGQKLGVELANASLGEIREAFANHTAGSATIDGATDGLTHLRIVLRFFFPELAAPYEHYLSGVISPR